jgi:hypothetical protein
MNEKFDMMMNKNPYEGFMGQIYSVVDEELDKVSSKFGFELNVVYDELQTISYTGNDRIDIYVDPVTDRIYRISLFNM